MQHSLCVLPAVPHVQPISRPTRALPRILLPVLLYPGFLLPGLFYPDLLYPGVQRRAGRAGRAGLFPSLSGGVQGVRGFSLLLFPLLVCVLMTLCFHVLVYYSTVAYLSPLFDCDYRLFSVASFWP